MHKDSHDQQRVIMITGSASGIGAAVARNFAQPGACIICLGRRLDPLQELAEELRGQGAKAEAYAVDIRDAAAVQSCVETVVQRYQRLDVLVANAGIADQKPFHETTDAELRQILETNVVGTFACCRSAFQAMLPQRSGCIITVGSVVSVKGYACQAAYTASKHAVLGLTRSLCVEAQPYGIRVACIMPGGVATEMVRRTRPDLQDARMIEPADVASALRFLADLPGHIAIDTLNMRRWDAPPLC